MTEHSSSLDASCTNKARLDVLFAVVLGLSRTGRLVHRACYPLLRVANFVRELVVSILQGLYKNLWGATAGFAVALLSVVYTMSNLALRKAIREKLRQLGGATASSSCAGDRWFTHADLVGLPDPVQRYFRFALEEGTPLHRFTCVTVVGRMKLFEDRSAGSWKAMKAKHYTSTHRPGFVWVLTIQLASWFWVSGWEAYIKHAANMFFKLYSALKVVDAGGSEMDQSFLARFVAHAAFYPAALLPSSFLRWRPVDECTAIATIVDGAHTAVAEFTFNDVGEIVKVHTRDERRVIVEGAHYSEDPWTGHFSDYQRLSGVMVPTHVEGVWHLLGANFKHKVYTVTALQCSVDGAAFLE